MAQSDKLRKSYDASAARKKLTKRIVSVLSALILTIGVYVTVSAHSVAQVQTTKYFTPETVQMLIDHAVAGSPGLHVGDIVSYVIQFTPVPNGGSQNGVAGYITDYVPPGVEVVGASIVAKDGAGNFYDIAPNQPGTSYDGWGARGQQTYQAPFNTSAYDTSGNCAALGTPTVVTLTASGNWTVPAGVTSATVEVWGGGGGGGSTNTNNSGGGGGGGGGYSSSLLAVTPAAVLPYIIGAAGAAGTTTTAGGAGGASSFNGGVITVMA